MRDQSSDEMFIVVPQDSFMKVIMQAFADRKGVSLEVLRFTIDGTRVNAEDTPEMLEMEDGDQIDVHLLQRGGGDNTNSSDEDFVKDVSSDNLQHAYDSAQEEEVPVAQHVPAEISIAIIDQQVRVVVYCLFLCLFIVYCLFSVCLWCELSLLCFFFHIFFSFCSCFRVSPLT